MALIVFQKPARVRGTCGIALIGRLLGTVVIVTHQPCHRSGLCLLFKTFLKLMRMGHGNAVPLRFDWPEELHHPAQTPAINGRYPPRLRRLEHVDWVGVGVDAGFGFQALSLELG